jgi:dipeptidyl aminopeptidase/acylaminoacyl peptidase
MRGDTAMGTGFVGRLADGAAMHTVALLLAVAPQIITAQESRDRSEASRAPLQLVDVLAIREFPDRVPLDLSPDARFVTFTLRKRLRADTLLARATNGYFLPTGAPLDMAGTDVHVTDTRTGETRNISDGRGSSWGGAWSPDSRTLAFYSDRDGVSRVWVWDRETTTLRRVSDAPVRPYWGFQTIRWSPDGRSILVKLSPLGLSPEQLEGLLPATPGQASSATSPATTGKVTATVFVAKPAADTARRPALALDLDSARSFLNVELSDLGAVDVGSGRVKRLARHVRAIGYRWSPDGTRVAFTTRQPDAGRGLLVYDNYDLFVTDTLGQPRLVAPRMIQDYGQRFSWSPTGDRLAFQSRRALHVIATSPDAASRQVTPAEREFTHEYRAPLWRDRETLLEATRDTLWRISVLTGRVTPVAAPAARRVMEIVASADAAHAAAGTIPLAVQDVVTKRAGFHSGSRQLLEDDIALGATDLSYHLDVSDDGRTIAYVVERSDRPPEVWIADAAFARARRLTDLHSTVTRMRVGRTRLVRWTGPTGEPLSGALLLPADFEPSKRYPMIVKVYGGSRLSGRLNRFGLEAGVDNLQLLSTRGYAVLLPDAPLRVGSPLADLAATVMPGVDSVIAMGIADPERLGLLGHSYGGYSTLAILVQTTRFKAAVSSAGFSNLLTQYGEMRADGSAIGISWSERGQGRMGGSPWEFRARYLENSPFFFLDRVTTPVLLLHGGADRTVLPTRAEETFVALRRLGKEVTLVRYEGEEHHPGEWSIANATDYWDRIFEWFGRHLRPAGARMK